VKPACRAARNRCQRDRRSGGTRAVNASRLVPAAPAMRARVGKSADGRSITSRPHLHCAIPLECLARTGPSAPSGGPKRRSSTRRLDLIFVAPPGHSSSSVLDVLGPAVPTSHLIDWNDATTLLACRHVGFARGASTCLGWDGRRTDWARYVLTRRRGRWSTNDRNLGGALRK